MDSMGDVWEIELIKVVPGLDLGDRSEKEKSRMTSSFWVCSISLVLLLFSKGNRRRGKRWGTME